MVVIIEAEVSTEWQVRVTRWIVRSGCLYMMAWGIDCSSWDDSVDWANSDEFEGGVIPQDGWVVTTWHDDEPLEAALRYAKNVAVHSVVDLQRTILLHISTAERRDELIKAYDAA